MEFFEVIRKRHSYRGSFQPLAVPEEDIHAIMEAGLRAPSGYNQQTTSFIVVTDADLRKKIAELVPTAALKTAPVIVIPVSKHQVTHENLAFEIEDYAASVENIMLAITAKGYAGVWMDGDVKLNNVRERLGELLHVPEDRTVRAIIPFGVPEEEWQQKEKKAFEERVHFNQF
jgi:nitroreductase